MPQVRQGALQASNVSNVLRCCWVPLMSRADSAPAAVMALMVIGATVGAVARVVEELEGEAREVEREVLAWGEGEGKGGVMDVNETDNEGAGAGAEDEEMASPQEEEQQGEGVVRERIPARHLHSLPVYLDAQVVAGL